MGRAAAFVRKPFFWVLQEKMVFAGYGRFLLGRAYQYFLGPARLGVFLRKMVTFRCFVGQ